LEGKAPFLESELESSIAVGADMSRFRFVEGIGLGGGTMLAPTYVSENSPRAIRGFLVGFFQLLLVMGSMMAYFINYGALLHLSVSQILSASSTPGADGEMFPGKSKLDGSSGVPIDLSCPSIRQYAVLPREPAVAGIKGQLGQGK
jgi:hypothetical protein